MQSESTLCCRTCGEAKTQDQFELRSDTGHCRTACRACRKTYLASWHAKNAVRVQAYLKEAKDRDPKAWRARDAAYSRQWREKNREQSAEVTRRYYRNNLEKARLRSRAKAHSRQRLGTLSPTQIRQQLERQRERCFYCRAHLNGKYHMDHVIPISAGGLTVPENMVASCPTCNLRKWAHVLMLL